MNPLLQAIDDYLTLRRALGFKLSGHDRMLADFVAHLEHSGASTITVQAALEWATKPAAAQPIRWRARLCIVRGFARYLHSADSSVEVPAVDLLPHRHHRPIPYLYSPADIHALLAAAGQIRAPLRAATYQTCLGLLAATGIRVGEAIRLDRTNVDLTAGLITIRETKFNKSRRLPVHSTTVAALHDYTRLRDQLCRPRRTASFFVSTTGARLIDTNLHETFRKLVTQANIGPGKSPKIHGLRHSFAVATLLGWYRDGVDVQARLPLLSAYLGHGHPSSTYWYLSAHQSCWRWRPPA